MSVRVREDSHTRSVGREASEWSTRDVEPGLKCSVRGVTRVPPRSLERDENRVLDGVGGRCHRGFGDRLQEDRVARDRQSRERCDRSLERRQQRGPRERRQLQQGFQPPDRRSSEDDRGVLQQDPEGRPGGRQEILALPASTTSRRTRSRRSRRRSRTATRSRPPSSSTSGRSPRRAARTSRRCSTTFKAAHHRGRQGAPTLSWKASRRMAALETGDWPIGDRAVDSAFVEGALRLLLEQIDRAVSHGARIVCGGKRVGARALSATSVLTGISPQNPVFAEELFGVPRSTKSKTKLPRLRSPYGLGASVFTARIRTR